MAEIDKPVRNVMAVAIVTMSRVPVRPTLPSTQPKRRYMITPKMVSTLGVYTPLKVPNEYPCFSVVSPITSFQSLEV